MAIDSSDRAAGMAGTSADAIPLTRFWRPKYWVPWLLVAWLWTFSRLPWRLAIRVHKALGRLVWRLASRRRDMVERSLAGIFPEFSHDEIRGIGRRHFESLSACLAETAFAWFGRVDHSLTKFSIEGDQHVRVALAAGRGVILYTGHFTTVEIFGPILKEMFPLFGFMFNRRSNPLLDEIQRRGRQYAADLSFPNTAVRTMIRALGQNAVVWYAPDQTYGRNGTLTLPFFGEPTTVSTATCRLARSTGAAIVPFAYRRLPDDSGYVLHFEPPIDDVSDDVACTRRLLEILEDFIRVCPDQYAWTSHRLRGGSRDAGT